MRDSFLLSRSVLPEMKENREDSVFIHASAKIKVAFWVCVSYYNKAGKKWKY